MNNKKRMTEIYPPRSTYSPIGYAKLLHSYKLWIKASGGALFSTALKYGFFKRYIEN